MLLPDICEGGLVGMRTVLGEKEPNEAAATGHGAGHVHPAVAVEVGRPHAKDALQARGAAKTEER